MKLLEYEAKEIFATYGIPVPQSGGVITDVRQLPEALKKAGGGPWVLKAQVLAGGRGKAGGVKIAKTPAEAEAVAKAMVGMKMVTHQTHGKALVVGEVLVNKCSDIKREIYIAVAMDRKGERPVVIASAEGGVAIEELAQSKPEAILKVPLDAVRGIEPYQARGLAFKLGIPAKELGSFVRFATALARIFIDLDASLVEVNPLIVTPEDKLVALDGKIVTDDNALFRQKSLAERPDRESTDLELKAKKVGINYIGLDGDIGCMVNGAGLAMATMDTVALAGGMPANFLDVGGGATADQVTAAFKIILADPKVRAVLVNIFGGIMKCDVIAQGVLEAVKKVELKVPLIVRLEGTNVEQGRDLLKKSGLKLTSAVSLWDAAQKAVSAVTPSAQGGRRRSGDGGPRSAEEAKQ
ncbi:MAG: ADP-forming succinate--CoA ligase subunit beta [Elusimicrobia bacterium]|nr:ADP-forming succinate--CoA ligase subunit beta [Elusimicrobiota bacterium]